MQDLINHPEHYELERLTFTKVYEPIDFCAYFGFSLGNAFKYLFRRKHKGSELLDLQKAEFYLKRALGKERTDTYKILFNLLCKQKEEPEFSHFINAFVENKDFLSLFQLSLNGVQTVLDFTQSELAKLQQ